MSPMIRVIYGVTLSEFCRSSISYDEYCDDFSFDIPILSGTSKYWAQEFSGFEESEVQGLTLWRGDHYYYDDADNFGGECVVGVSVFEMDNYHMNVKNLELGLESSEKKKAQEIFRSLGFTKEPRLLCVAMNFLGEA